MQIDANDAFDIQFFESVTRYNPKDIDALEFLGGLYSKYGLSKNALNVDRRLARINPNEARVHYNLACSLSLLGRKRDAVSSLAKAIDLGYNDYNWMFQDPDLVPLRGYQRFEDLAAALPSIA